MRGVTFERRTLPPGDPLPKCVSTVPKLELRTGSGSTFFGSSSTTVEDIVSRVRAGGVEKDASSFFLCCRVC